MAGALPSCLAAGAGLRVQHQGVSLRQAHLHPALGAPRASRPAGVARHAGMPLVRAVAEAERPTQASEGASVSIDNSQPGATVISVEGYNRPGLLTALTATFRDLGLDVSKVRKGKAI